MHAGVPYETPVDSNNLSIPVWMSTFLVLGRVGHHEAFTPRVDTVIVTTNIVRGIVDVENTAGVDFVVLYNDGV
jgi:hypothetical protein